ncbi:MAG: hypothetical protein CVV02_00375 [Firmicutes bacterium HGW-Firmicutes-7]|nr:MAG: hypothetical protein CVV02_00375 [Firmicutes bacterium HGW-Firmicutes-7]
MKLKTILIIALLVTSIFVVGGCAKDQDETPNVDENTGDQTDDETDENEDPDVVTTASIVDNGEDFLEAVGPDAFWLAAIVKDITIDEDIVVEGEYTVPDREDPSKEVPAGRKIALYAQDEDRNKTASYTLTAPRMIVKSKDTKIQGGTFVGDVYVQETGFNLVDATIEGNVYFASEELMTSFKFDDKSEVTGDTEVKTEQ